MTQAQLSVTLPEGIWVGDVTRTYPDASFRVLSAVPDDHAGFALVQVSSPDIVSIVAAMERHDGITELSVLQRSEGKATLQVETTTPLLLLSARESGISVELPVEIRDGTAAVGLSGPHDRLSAFGNQLEAIGLDFEVEYIQERLHADQLLSARQRELLLEAVDAGYYDTPRECTLTELADRLDIAKSTCSETLHRAEERVVKEFVDGLAETLTDRSEERIALNAD